MFVSHKTVPVLILDVCERATITVLTQDLWTAIALILQTISSAHQLLSVIEVKFWEYPGVWMNVKMIITLWVSLYPEDFWSFPLSSGCNSITCCCSFYHLCWSLEATTSTFQISVVLLKDSSWPNVAVLSPYLRGEAILFYIVSSVERFCN